MRFRKCTVVVLLLIGAPVLAAPKPGLTAAKTWDRNAASHLLRRAGFGGTPEEIDRLANANLQDAVASLIHFETVAQTDPAFRPIDVPDAKKLRKRLKTFEPEPRKELHQRLRQLGRLQMEDLRAWWMRRMVVTRRPLEEKMTLFWHGYFTSGFREVRSSKMMLDQHRLLRKNALGNFRELLVGISQNPAMLRYLDSASNRKSAPNENFARELLELFTMGEGNYSENDIKQAARALTGWTLRNGEFKNVRHMHDPGKKTFMGQTGTFDGNDIIDIILQQPAMSRHLANKLLLFFVSPDPSPKTIDNLAATIRYADYDMREVMRELLSSKVFYSPKARHSLIKSPVQLVVGTLRQLEIEPYDLAAFVSATRGMGQQLFQPPNVKGWDGGQKWMTSATLFARYNFASAVLAGTESKKANKMMGGRGGPGRHQRINKHRRELERALYDVLGIVSHGPQASSSHQPPFDPLAIVEKEHLKSADRVLNHFVFRVLGMEIDHLQRRRLRGLLTDGNRRFDARNNNGRTRIVSLINALLTMPEYQVY